MRHANQQNSRGKFNTGRLPCITHQWLFISVSDMMEDTATDNMRSCNDDAMTTNPTNSKIFKKIPILKLRKMV